MRIISLRSPECEHGKLGDMLRPNGAASMNPTRKSILSAHIGEEKKKKKAKIA